LVVVEVERVGLEQGMGPLSFSFICFSSKAGSSLDTKSAWRVLAVRFRDDLRAVSEETKDIKRWLLASE
jgi:hypothetical protein